MDNGSITSVWPEDSRQRLALIGLIVIGLFASSAVPIRNAAVGHHVNKDYPLWYIVGHFIRWDQDLYQKDPSGEFYFLYLPPAAMVLAAFSHLGSTGMVVALGLVNSLAWLMAVWLSARLCQVRSYWAWSLSMIFWWPFFHDCVMLGQPNLVLLVFALSGLMLIQAGRSWLGGFLLACAIVTKAFPLVILCYTLYRRQWIGTLAALVWSVGLLAAPGLIRGHERNWNELNQWVNGMLLSNNEQGFSQRGGQNLSWKNHSIWAVTQRFVRPIDLESESDSHELPLRTNVVSLSYSGAIKVTLLLAALIGLAFIWVMPARICRTPQTDAAELALLLALVPIASPVCYGYYLIWELPAVMFLFHQVFTRPPHRMRAVALCSLILSGLLHLLLIQLFDGPHYAQAFGCGFWAVLVHCAALGYYLRNSANPIQ